MRLQDETYVSGSGFGGCDHYDGGYDNGVITDGKRDWESHANLQNFVVADDVEILSEKDQENSDSEEEWSDSSSEEDSDSDRDWD